MRPIMPLLALLLATPLSASTPLPDWLAGTWAREAGATWAEQLWTAPRGGQMLGLSREGFGPDVTGWAQLRIEKGRDGGPVLVAQETGGAPVRYQLAVASEAAIEFTNPSEKAHQRIRYSREGQLLVIETSRLDGSGAERWNYRPVAVPAD